MSLLRMISRDKCKLEHVQWSSIRTSLLNVTTLNQYLNVEAEVVAACAPAVAARVRSKRKLSLLSKYRTSSSTHFLFSRGFLQLVADSY